MRTSPQGRAAAVLLLGLGVVAGARLLAPQSAPPLYDSFVVPSPYVYLQPSPGQPGNPQSASDTVPYTGGDPGALVLATRENPPQAQLILAAGTLAVPAGAHAITLSITPVATPNVAPPNGVVRGNVYRFTAVTDGGVPVPLNAAHQATVVLRGPVGMGSGTLELFAGGAWTPLTTNPVAGPDIFTDNTVQLGDFALVAPAPATPAQSDGRGWLVWVVGAVAIAVALGVPIALRVRARRRPRPRPRPGGRPRS